MTDVQEGVYGELLNEAVNTASHICATEGAYWRQGDIERAIKNNGIVGVPSNLPAYKINQKIQIASGSAIKMPGIYMPDIENSCAQFLYSSEVPAPPTMTALLMRELRHPITGEVYGETAEYERRPCIWYLVERDADAPMRPYVPGLSTTTSIRVDAGELCPQTGFYFTPAIVGSRQMFVKGALIPDSKSDYGSVIWQWGSNQAD